MKNTPILTSFNGGELTPLMGGRVDVAKYAIGCRRMENFIPVTQGPAVARPGFRFVQEVKDSQQRTWFVRFEFSEDDAYLLEAGNQYLRFYANRGQVQSGGLPYEIASPYTAADLTNPDGTFALRYAGTGDLTFMVLAGRAPQLLSRLATTNWTLAPLELNPPPFATQNGSGTTVYASAAVGAVSLVASSAVFRASDVGTYFYMGERDVRDVKQWEAAVAILAGDVRRSNGLNYQALNAATTGSVKPTHTEGAVFDGNTGVQWQFLDPGYGWLKITAVSDSTHATGTVISRLPAGAVSSAQPTTRWARQAWNDTDGWPTAVTFFRERLVFARGNQLWFSVAGDFFNFAYQVGGTVTADSGFDRSLSSALANSIRWMSPGEVLLVGTSGDEWAIVESNENDAFGPTNCKTKPQSAYGSSLVAPQTVGTDTVFIQKSRRKARAMAFRFEENGFASPDVTVFAEHVTKTGIIDMAYQQEPWGVLWAARADGVLACMTLNREQDAVAWHRHPLAGGIVECVESIPAPGGARDDLWAIVRYTINGQTRRYVAYLADPEDDEMAQADWCYSDMALTYRGVPATHISGLGHLEGQTVWILADGASHPDRVVVGGAITLQVASSVVTVGLPSVGFLEPMNLEGGANGTAQGKTKRAHLVKIRVLRSLGGKAGPDEALLKPMRYRRPADRMDNPPPAFTGDVELEWDGDYDPDLTMLVTKDRPMPLTVLAIMPQYVVSEGR